uniref:Helicase C-terminal domain-containing protein n=1 Tax=Setaria italica TaxID=4555 RepID=K3YPD8_SETIT
MPRVVVFIDSDEDDEGGGGQAGRVLGKGAAIAGGGEALQPVNDVGLNPVGPGALGLAVVPIPPRKENPRALSRPRAQNPRAAPSSPPPVAAARAPARPQPEIINISDEEDGVDAGFRGVLPLRMVEGGGSGLRLIKDEPFDDSGGDWARSASAKPPPALAAAAAPPGTSYAKRKRKREPSRLKPDARGDNRALDRSSSASGTGRRAMGSSSASRERNSVKSRESGREGAGGRSVSSKKSFVPSEESSGAPGNARHGGSTRSGESRCAPGKARRGGSTRSGESRCAPGKARRGGSTRSGESRCAPGKARRGGSTRSGERSNNALPAGWVGTTVGSRIRSRSRQQARVQYATYSARVPSEETEEDEDAEEVQEQEKKKGEEVEVMEVDEQEESGSDTEVAQESEQEEAAKGRSKQNGHGHSEEVQVQVQVQEHEQKTAGDMEVMEEEDSGSGNEVSQESEQEEAVEARSRQNGHGDSEEVQEQEQKTGEDVEVDEDSRSGNEISQASENEESEVGEKEMLEEEGDNQEDSHSIYDGEDEEEDGESEDDGHELGETGEVQPLTSSNAMAGGSVRSGGDGPRVFKRRIFEGICLLENPDSVGYVAKGIQGRTRSQRKCKDKKLLKRGTFSKPYNIDIPDSTSESEEDIVPPALQGGLMSSSDEDSRIFGKRKRRRARNKRWRKGLSTSSDESKEYRAYARDAGGAFRRLKKGASNLQVGKGGSNPGRAKYNGPNGGNPTDMANAQDGISFKRKAHTMRMKKRGRAAKDAYDELLNTLFAGWENHIDVPDHAENGNSLPLVFSFGDEDEPYEKTENDKYQEDLWRECGIAFESMNIGSHEEDGQAVPPAEEASCKNGKHEFIIDEQIGVRCKHCHVVDLEIRHVLPAMGKISAERELAIEPELDSMFKEMLNIFEENDVLVSNGHGVPCNFGGRRAGSVWDLIPGVKEDMFPHQQDAFEFIMEKTIAMGLDAEYKISLASIHPSLIARAKLSEKEESMVDKPKLESLRSSPSEGVKTRFVLEIVNLCEALNERVLVFSQYLDPLSLIMEQLKARFNWAEGKEILLMSGNVLVKNRQTMMETFNNMKSKAKVMLASTKACCEGITLIGASRVVLLDVVWNPSVGRQAIGRAYRIGQEKIVYTYNLIAEGTAEKSKYDRQAKKEHMSKLLFSKEVEHGDLPPELTLNDRILEEMTAREDLKKLFVKIYIDNQTDGSPGETEKNTTCAHA